MKVRKVVILGCVFVSGYFNISLAQTPCELLYRTNLANCHKQYDKALEYSRLFVKKYPHNSLHEEFRLSMATHYFNLGKYDSARLVIAALLDQYISNKSDNFYLDCKHENIYYKGEYCWGLIYALSANQIKRKSMLLLSDISQKQKLYQQALYELNEAEGKYPYISFCGNGQAGNALRMTMKYAEVYKNLHQIDSAIWLLSRFMMDNRLVNTETLVDSLTSLLVYHLGPEMLLDSIKNSIANLRVHREVVRSEIIRELDFETEEILQVKQIQTYGRVVYWNFLGRKIRILNADDYASRMTYPNHENRKSRQLERYESDAKMIARAEKNIKLNRIYQQIIHATK